MLERAEKNINLGWTFKRGDNKIDTRSNEIVFRGLKDIPSADLDLGFKLKRVYIDEPQTIRSKVLKHYLQNVVSWGITGVPGARINLSLNPPAFKHEYLGALFYNRDCLLYTSPSPRD